MTWRRRVLLRGLGVMLAAATLGVVATVVLALMDTSRVTTSEQLRGPHRFGFPLPWVTQVSTLDPPLPARVRLGSPLASPTWLDERAFLLNSLALGGVAAVGVVGAMSIWTWLLVQ